MPPPTTTTKSPPGAVTRCQTLKQAKAAFQARGRPALSLREQRQLERAAELELRAWRSKEQEKRKAEAGKRRGERERAARQELVMRGLGTQRRRDRFGYRSSQFHLGAFFGVGGGGKGGGCGRVMDGGGVDGEVVDGEVVDGEVVDGEVVDGEVVDGKVGVEEEFGECEVDDEMLLDALDDATMLHASHSPDKASTRQPGAMSDSAFPSTPQSAITPLQRSTTAPPRIAEHDPLAAFWAELDSSTQIARELLSPQPPAVLSPKTAARAESFDAGDFDLTDADLEELDPATEGVRKESDNPKAVLPPPQAKTGKIAPKLPPSQKPAHPTAAKQDVRLMPPPAPPVKRSDQLAMPPPALPAKPRAAQAQHTNPTTSIPTNPNQQQNRTKGRMLFLAPPTSARAKTHSLERRDRNSTPALARPFAKSKATTKATTTTTAARPNPHPVPPNHHYYADFTLLELETFVEDDLQLTQAAVGGGAG
ncbi:hypothetical protein LTR08_003929 [Meristemomyces frigidus]|nr:hypothetical protein LTR08_003929 [Meristemomyces frigidus]